MLKKIIVGVSLICAVVLGALLWQSKQMDKAELAQYEELSDKSRPLLVKKAEIEQKLVDLENEYEASKLPRGTTQVLYTGLEEQVYSACYPAMEERDYKGILAVSLTQLPGMEGRITVEQFQELLGAGWKVCIKWDTTTPVDTWWPELEKKFAELGAEMATTAYFTTGTYSRELDEELQERGITIAVHHGEADFPLIQTTEEEGIWHLGAVGLMGEKPKLRLREAVAQKGNITYLVGFELDDEMYDERSFLSMLDCFKQYEESSELLVLDVEETRQHYHERLGDYGQEREDAYKKEKESIEKELEEVEKELSNLKVQ